MKIAIDLDGTAWLHREFFKELVMAFKFMGHEVGILTAHSLDFEEKDIKLWLARGFLKPDFYIAKPDRKSHIGEFKRNAIKEHNIDVLFDDFGGNNPAIEKTFLEKFDTTCGPLILKVIGGEE